ncbi:MAG: hypothetical protein ACT4OG_09250 [Alphaproteobacteria bacterium]
MVAYYRKNNADDRGVRRARTTLTDDLFGMTQEEFRNQAQALNELSSLSPATRERLKHQLVQRLKTPVDPPSWGPDWARRRNKELAKSEKKRALFARFGKKEPPQAEPAPLSKEQRSDAEIIAANLEKSRQVSEYRWLYVGAGVLAVVIAALAMLVDYEIIRGDIWTRALSNEFMEVPDSLKESVFFKSLQVVFAALAIHFMLTITGVYGRNTLISTAFVLTCIMVVCLGYLVAYNNMEAGTSARFDAVQENTAPKGSTIDQLFNQVSDTREARVEDGSVRASTASLPEMSLPLPKLSERSLANAQSWLWLAFASVIFFIVTTIAALYMQIAEHNVRNFHIARDYKTRRRQYAQLHLLEMAGRRG